MKENKANGQATQIVVFTLDDGEYAVDVSQVREVVRAPEITQVPNAPDFVEGIINIRGEIVPVIDLRKRFRVTPQTTEDTRIILLEVAGQYVGFEVDEVREVLDIEPTQVEQPSGLVLGSNSGFVQGICKLSDRLVIVVNLSAVLSSEEISNLDLPDYVSCQVQLKTQNKA